MAGFNVSGVNPGFYYQRFISRCVNTTCVIRKSINNNCHF
jgi:hypothetical protein